jgi:signal transduction histidine kinase
MGIMLLAVPIFVVSLGILYYQSRHIIRVEAIGHANSVLNATMQRLIRNLMVIENATNANTWIIEQNISPETFLEHTNRIVRLNPLIDGCSISAEPYTFKKYGKYFSAYTVRKPDTITTVIEEDYEYFRKVWYETPKKLKAGCWVVYTDEADTLKLTIDGMLATYCKPIFSADSSVVGIISTDLSLLRLSKLMSEVKPYPNSYLIMIDEEGRFLIHPDSTRLFTKTIFSDIDPRKQSEIIALGHEMTSGRQGRTVVDLNGSQCLICYQPVTGTKWSIAIICPDSGILAGYYKLTKILIPLLIIGLLIIMLLCYRTVAHSIRPLNLLLDKTQNIASGNMEFYISKSQREDVIGLLQNSFATMLSSLNFHLGSVRYSTEQTQLRNEELERATRMAKEAEKQKTTFIQNVTHQIRTPLNIIMGFAQVLGKASNEKLSDEELKSITNIMDHNSKHLNRMLRMLFDSSETGLSEELNSLRYDLISCNSVAQEAITYAKTYYSVNIGFQSDVPDDFNILCSQSYLMRILQELLYNSAKYSDGKHISLSISLHDNHIHFVIEDTGKSITESNYNDIFKFFTKGDDLTEGLGLGLPLAKRHAINMGGDLKLDTEYHDGCRFIVIIPIQNT